MRKSNRPFIPVNDYSEFNIIIIVRWNKWRLELQIITQPYSKLY